MGIRLKNLITKINNTDDKQVLEAIKNIFPSIKTKEFEAGFKGIIGQINETEINQECEETKNFAKYNVKDIYELFTLLDNFDEKVIELSLKFPERTFVYLDVDNFEDNFETEGFLVKNGNISVEQIRDGRGHISLLQEIDEKFYQTNFAPFKANFFE